MALREPLGTKFNFKKDWRALFQRDTWFMYRRDMDVDRIVLKRFNVLNVVRFFVFRTAVALLMLSLRPLALLAWKYWFDTEAQDVKVLSGLDLFTTSVKDLPRFFRLAKEE